jgi:hypothetical protein
MDNYMMEWLDGMVIGSELVCIEDWWLNSEEIAEQLIGEWRYVDTV